MMQKLRRVLSNWVGKAHQLLLLLLMCLWHKSCTCSVTDRSHITCSSGHQLWPLSFIHSRALTIRHILDRYGDHSGQWTAPSWSLVTSIKMFRTPTWCHKPCTGNTSNTNRAIFSERDSQIKQPFYRYNWNLFQKSIPMIWQYSARWHKSCPVTNRYFPLAPLPVTNHRVAALWRRVSNFGLILSIGSPWIQFNLYSCCLDSRWPPAHLWYHLRSQLKLGQYCHNFFPAPYHPGVTEPLCSETSKGSLFRIKVQSVR